MMPEYADPDQTGFEGTPEHSPGGPAGGRLRIPRKIRTISPRPVAGKDPDEPETPKADKYGPASTVNRRERLDEDERAARRPESSQPQYPDLDTPSSAKYDKYISLERTESPEIL